MTGRAPVAHAGGSWFESNPPFLEDNANINPLVQIVITVLKQRNLYDLYDIGAGAGEDDARAIVSAVLDAQAHILDDNGEVPCRVWVCPHGFAIHYKERIPVGTGEWIHSTRTDVCDDNGAGRVMVDVVPKQAMQEFMAEFVRAHAFGGEPAREERGRGRGEGRRHP